jgi:CRISPR-associated endoribonuclease Cas6
MVKNHRIVVLINKLNGPEVTRDNEVSLLWRFLEKNKNLQHNQEEKTFTWNMEAGALSSYTMTFSSYDTKLVNDFFEIAKGLAGQAVTVGTTIWQVKEAMEIQDIDYIGEAIRISTVNGMVAMHKAYNAEGKKYNKTYDILTDKEAWISSVINRLIRRTNNFFGTAYEKKDVSITRLTLDGYDTVKYKNASIPVQNVQFKLSAPKEIIESAIYGGIGSHTGSGFGMTAAI